MHRLLNYLATVLALVLLGAAPVLADKRVALVIGNDRYPSLPLERQLGKAVNDADVVGDLLARLGFQVIYGRNLGRQALIDKLAEFTGRLDPGDTALFFYAGHGVAIAGVNYLVPSDVPRVTPDAEARVRGASIAEGDLIAEIQAKGVRVAVLVLDACRDNPFPRAGGRSIGNTRGLSESKPARGVFTIYSAGIGQEALDRLEPNDANRNSVFTRVFVEQLVRPGLHLGELAVEVRERVHQLALKAKNESGQPAPHEQTPAYYDQTVGGRVYLAGLPVTPPHMAQTFSDEAARVWAVTKDTTSVAVLEDFIRQFGSTPYGSMARARLEELKRNQVATVAPPVAPATPPTPVQPAVGIFSTSRSASPLTAAEERALKPKDGFKECTACHEMVVVPAGSFMMGSPASEAWRYKDEGPQHRVTVARPFAVGKFAITFDEWDACVAGGGCGGHRPSDQNWGRGTRPVIEVSWNDAQAYVAWLSRRTGKTYRLLSEAEREYVTRAGTTTPFWTGDTISTAQANYDGTRIYGSGMIGEDRRRTVPVDSFQANPFGLYQMHGNVWEWTQDCWNDSYRNAPTDGSALTFGDCGRRVLRGGSWNFGPVLLRSASRSRIGAVDRSDVIGFRVARTLVTP